MHFEDLFRRFGTPIIVLNLVKQSEKQPRESLLGDAFRDAVAQINLTIPSAERIEHIDFDFSRESKAKNSDVIAKMNTIAERALHLTGYFHSGRQLYANYMKCNVYPEPGRRPYASPDDVGRFQTGLLRANCIDSLDRTNAAQFITGKVALGYQLFALGFTDSQRVDFDDDVVEILLDMYQGMGNKLALQYGGSRLAHTISTYREKTFASHSRDLLASLKRFYSNSFTDKEKQDSINLFLGNFCPWRERSTDLWSLETDYFLHMKKNESLPEEYMLCTTPWWEAALQRFNARILQRQIRPILPFLPQLRRALEQKRLGATDAITTTAASSNSKSVIKSLVELPIATRSPSTDHMIRDIYDPRYLSSFDLMFSRRFNVPVHVATDRTAHAPLSKSRLYAHVNTQDAPLEQRIGDELERGVCTASEQDALLLRTVATTPPPVRFIKRSSLSRSSAASASSSSHSAVAAAAAMLDGDSSTRRDSDKLARTSASQGRKSQRLLSLYGIKRWFAFMHDRRNASASSTEGTLPPKLIGNSAISHHVTLDDDDDDDDDDHVLRRVGGGSARNSANTITIGNHVVPIMHSVFGGRFNEPQFAASSPYQMLTESVADDYSLELNSLVVDRAHYERYLSMLGDLYLGEVVGAAIDRWQPTAVASSSPHAQRDHHAKRNDNDNKDDDDGDDDDSVTKAPVPISSDPATLDSFPKIHMRSSRPRRRSFSLLSFRNSPMRIAPSPPEHVCTQPRVPQASPVRVQPAAASSASGARPPPPPQRRRELHASSPLQPSAESVAIFEQSVSLARVIAVPSHHVDIYSRHLASSRDLTIATLKCSPSSVRSFEQSMLVPLQVSSADLKSGCLAC